VPDHAVVGVDTFVDRSGVAKAHDLFIGSIADDSMGSMHDFARDFWLAWESTPR
jgi:hypothetical protein